MSVTIAASLIGVLGAGTAQASSGSVTSKQVERAVSVPANVSSPASGASTQAPASIVTSLAKKALVKLLRSGGSKVPGKYKKWATKMADVLESTDELQETGLVIAFQKIGMPYDLARDAVKWCVVFLGA